MAWRSIARVGRGCPGPWACAVGGMLLGMSTATVYYDATFYSIYNLAPTAKFKLTFGSCLPCGLKGSLAAADHLKRRLGVDFNETTPDGKFTLKEGECMGACAMAPVVLVNNKRMCDYMSNDKLDALVNSLRDDTGKG